MPLKLKVDCMETLPRSILAQGFSEKVVDAATKGHCDSTIQVYDDCASHFSRWCAARALNAYTSPVIDIA